MAKTNKCDCDGDCDDDCCCCCDEVSTWVGAAVATVKVIGLVAVVLILAQCESGKIW